MNKLRALIFLFVLAVAGCMNKPPVVVLETAAGNIEVEVYPDKAPQSASDFLYYVDEHLYDGEGFYRVVRPDNDPREMGMSLIQGGRLDFLPRNPTIDLETTQQTGLSHIAGSLGIGRAAPDTGSAAFFFINAGDNTFLDYGGARNPDGQGYAVFGKVTQGMDVVRAIQAGATKRESDDEVTKGQFLEKPVIITKAYRK